MKKNVIFVCVWSLFFIVLLAGSYSNNNDFSLFLFLNITSTYLIIKPLSDIISSEKNFFIIILPFKLIMSLIFMPLYLAIGVWELIGGIFVSLILKSIKKKSLLKTDIKPVIRNKQEQTFVESPQQGTPVNIGAYSIGYGDIDGCLKTIITDEFKKNGVNIKNNILDIEKRKCVFTLVYVFILFICISLLFFHTGFTALFIILIVTTCVYILLIKKYNNVNYLIKEIKSRPDEKISYIVANHITRIGDNKKYKFVRLSLFLLVIVISLFVYREPHMIFERQGEDYVVRFYTYGIFKNDKKLIIPSSYKGREVVGIRGDVFANVYTIEEVVLPETIEEIRGGAFKNAINLEEINLPEGIKEIKGNTFEGCTHLKSIYIPEGVTRIGGSAFRNCVRLTNASIPKTVKEIGSSAFRSTALKEVCISESTIVNMRAFKDTNTHIYYYESGCGFDYGE